VKYHCSKAGVDKTWVKEKKDFAMVSQEHVDDTNANTWQNGHEYIIDEEGTAEFYENQAKILIAKEERKNIEKAIAVGVLQKAAETSMEVLSENLKQVDEIKKSRKK